MLIPTTAPDKCAIKLGWGPEEGSGGEKRSQTARPTSELTVENRGEKTDRINVKKSAHDQSCEEEFTPDQEPVFPEKINIFFRNTLSFWQGGWCEH